MVLNDYPTVKYGLIYTFIFGGFTFLFFLFCYTVSYYTGGFPLAVLDSVARAAYSGRISHIQFNPDCARHDPELGYLLRPGSCRFTRSEFDISVQVNSFGLRDDEESLDAPEIIMLGDSHTMGLGVAAEASFSSLVEQDLQTKTLNAGISSYGTAREMMLFDRLDTTNAKYVVLQYCDNDYKENAAYFRGDGDLDVMDQEEYVQWTARNEQQQESFLNPGLVVFGRVTDKLAKFLTAGQNGKAAVKEADAFQFILEKKKDSLENKTVIVFELNGHNKNDNRFVDNVSDRFEDSGLNIVFLRVGDILTDEDYFNLDSHMRPSGHRKMADAIVETIRLLENEDAGDEAVSVAGKMIRN